MNWWDWMPWFWFSECWVLSQSFHSVFFHFIKRPSAAAASAKSLQSCLTLCNPIDGRPLGSSVPGILQARILEWVAISFSNARNWKVKMKSLSRALLLVTPWTAAHQAPPSMGFSRQEYWSGVPLPSPRGPLVPLYFLLIKWYHQHIWGYWYFSWHILIPACEFPAWLFHDVFWI